MKVAKRKLLSKVPRFNLSMDDEFHVCFLRMKAALRGQKIATTLTNEDVYTEVADESLALIIYRH